MSEQEQYDVGTLCRCSAKHRLWNNHNNYCPTYMQGRIAELEAQIAAVKDIQRQMTNNVSDLRDTGARVFQASEIKYWLGKLSAASQESKL